MKNRITLDINNIKPFINQKQVDLIMPEIIQAHEKIKEGTGKGGKFLGWLHLGSKTSEKLISRIKNTGAEIRKNSDVLLCIGIGGSYLGARAGIEFLSPHFPKEDKEKSLKI